MSVPASRMPAGQPPQPAQPSRSLDEPDWLDGGGGASQSAFEALLERTGDDLDAFDPNAAKPAPESSAPASAASQTEGGDDVAVSAPEGETADAGAEPEPSSGDEGAGDNQEATGQDAETEGLEAADVAELLGFDPGDVDISEDGQILITTKVDGQSNQVTLADLRKGYQLERHVTRKSEALAEQQRQTAQYLEQRNAEVSSAFETALAAAKAMEGRLLAQFEGIDWDKLRVERPEEWAARRVEMDQSAKTLQAETQAILAQHQQYQYQQQAHMGQQRQQWIEQQERQLYEHLPELKPEAPGRRELLGEFEQYLMGYGFQPSEVRDILDHRMFRVIHDAVRFHKGPGDPAKDPAKTAAEKLVKAPTRVLVRRRGAPATPESTAQNRRAEALKRLRKSGSDRDAMAFALNSGIADSLL